DEPIADEARAVLDGHIVLARELAARGHWPAIDVLASLSRLMPQVADREHVAAAAALRRMLALYERQRDLIAVGAYRAGSDPATDEAIARIDDIEHFLQQAPDERPPLRQSRARLLELFSPP
ncbi:MAG TPA: EscN/YscN/HrcN family type III secretion system ATPase, partial [Polyangia bacterium]|nr:EscN/YscN/HrcN family type III secretion system ATPase [Polyangia bacterium]